MPWPKDFALSFCALLRAIENDTENQAYKARLNFETAARNSNPNRLDNTAYFRTVNAVIAQFDTFEIAKGLSNIGPPDTK